jgi:hypothetical protein
VNIGAPAIGRVAITEVAQGLMTAFSDLLVTVEDVFPSAEGAQYLGTLTGTNAGKRVRIGGYQLWTLGVGGRIAESKGILIMTTTIDSFVRK